MSAAATAAAAASWGDKLRREGLCDCATAQLALQDGNRDDSDGRAHMCASAGPAAAAAAARGDRDTVEEELMKEHARGARRGAHTRYGCGCAANEASAQHQPHPARNAIASD